MAGPVEEFGGMTEADRRHFDFMETLLKVSNALTKEETVDVKLYCMHLIPKGRAEKLRRAVDVFVTLLELQKIDQENLVFLEEILQRIGRQDLVTNILRPFLRPDREIPENPELQPGINSEGFDEEGNSTSNAYVVLHGQVRMIQETLDRLRNNLARLSGTRRSQVKFRGYKKHKSILVHFSIPRRNTAVLKLMAYNSDPRLAFMGVKSLQIDAEQPIKVSEGGLVNDIKRQQTVDDFKVGCSTRTKRQRAPRNWTRLSALNLFSDTLPLYLQIAESLEYQGFSYSLVQALVQKDQLREQEKKKKDQLREQEMKQLIQDLKKSEVDFNTFMTMRSKLTISENRLKEVLEMNAALEKELRQTKEYAEKAARRITSHVTKYRGEKPQKADVSGDAGTARGEKDMEEESTVKDADKSPEVPSSDGTGDEKEEKNVTQQTIQKQLRSSTGYEGMAPRTTEDLKRGRITYGGRGLEPGKFLAPRGIVVSSTNEIFVADRGNRRIQVHNTEGVYLRHFPTIVPGTQDIHDIGPHDVCMDSNGKLWVVGNSKSAEHVVQYSTDGTALTYFDLQQIENFSGIAVDMRNNHILVTDADHVEVQVFHPNGSLVQKFGHPGGDMRHPGYITVDEEGNILVSDFITHSVYMFDESGKFLLNFGGPGSGEGQLRDPRGICTDSSGHIIVADRGNERVQLFTRHGEYVRTIATGLRVQGVAMGPEGQLLLTNNEDYSVTVLPSAL